jgi:hypothetical protein
MREQLFAIMVKQPQQLIISWLWAWTIKEHQVLMFSSGSCADGVSIILLWILLSQLLRALF